MEKNKKQLAVLAALVVLFLALVVMSLLKPRAKKAAAQAKASVQVPARLPGAAKERAASAYQSWGRDPFSVGNFAVETKRDLVLTGIIWDESKPYCLINGKIYKAGDEVSGVKIFQIKKDSVIIRSGDVTKVIKVGR